MKFLCLKNFMQNHIRYEAGSYIELSDGEARSLASEGFVFVEEEDVYKDADENNEKDVSEYASKNDEADSSEGNLGEDAVKTSKRGRKKK